MYNVLTNVEIFSLRTLKTLPFLKFLNWECVLCMDMGMFEMNHNSKGHFTIYICLISNWSTNSIKHAGLNKL